MIEWLAAGAGLAGLLAWLLRHRADRAAAQQLRLRDLEDRPVTELRVATDGPIKVVGTLWAIYAPLTAPFSGRPCLAWSIVVREGSGGLGPVLLEDGRVNAFGIDDGTGVATVRAQGGRLPLTSDLTLASGWTVAPTPRVSALLEAQRIVAKKDDFYRSLECTEAVLEEGDRVILYGECKLEIDPTASRDLGYREQPTRILLTGTSANPLLLYAASEGRS